MLIALQMQPESPSKLTSSICLHCGQGNAMTTIPTDISQSVQPVIDAIAGVQFACLGLPGGR